MNISIVQYIDETKMAEQKAAIVNARNKEKQTEFSDVLSGAVDSLKQTDNASSNISQSTTNGATDVGEGSKRMNNAEANYIGCPEELFPYFEEAAETYQVDIELLLAIAKAESDFHTDSLSHSGAMGVMQLMPGTAEGLGVTDAFDARQNIMGGSQYIAGLLERYDGDKTLALAAYNAGSGNVKKYGGVPPFTETQNYVKKVLRYYEEANVPSVDKSSNEYVAEIKQELNNLLTTTISRMNLTTASIEQMIDILRHNQSNQ